MFNLKSIGFFFLFLVWPPALQAHKYHASLTLLEYNATSETVEITLRVFTEDLEQIVASHGGKRSSAFNQEAQTFIADYVRARLQLQKNNQPLTLNWLGIETEVDTSYLYLEASMPGGFEALALRNQVFAELSTEQINTVNFKDSVGVRTQVHREGDGFKKLHDHKQ